MKLSVGRAALYVVGGLAIFAASFFTTLKAIDYVELSPLQQPSFDVTVLPRLRPGQTLDFSNGKNRNALLSGWSSPEPTGSWTDGHAAFVGFVLEGAEGAPTSTQVTIRAKVFLDGPTVSKQRVQVWSGSKQLAEYDLTNSLAELAIPLAGLNIAKNTPIILGFYLPDAISPLSAHLYGDPRVLGLFIDSLQVR